MQTYIYKLTFPNSHKVYIGQSLNPETRVQRHLQKLRDGIHHSKKLQQEYPECGKPELSILEVCDINSADTQEIYWIQEYNSYLDGYNSTKGGNGTGVGEDCPSAKYTIDDYLAVVAFLAHTDMSTKEIAAELGVGISTVLNISSQTNHLYLRDIVPEDWNLMINKQRHHANWRAYPSVISPDGVVHKVTSARAFSREHKLDQSDFAKMLNGKKLSVRGWKVC
jgi:hypothetical protein